MSADILTRAAALMRARAEAATPGPWFVPRRGTGIDAGEYDTVIGPGAVDCMSHCYGGTSTIEGDRLDQDQAHIAGMDPAFALTVADWLDDTAAIHTPERSTPHNEPYGCGQCFPHDGHWPCSDYESALTVARTYLGETS